MAGWINKTRKMISTVVSSLADDLEQTVQDLNDIIYRLGSTQDDRSSTHPQTSQDSVSEVGALHFQQHPAHTQHDLQPQDEQLDLLPPREQASSHSHKQTSIFIEQLKVAQTRQPKSSEFTSILNSRRFQSSPSLECSGKSVLVDEDTCVRTRRLESKFPVHSLISSSPCLRHKSVEPPDRDSLAISELHLRHSHLNSKTQLSSKHTLISVFPNVCPCHSQHSLKITHGMKRPGRVIRTQSAPKQEQAQSSAKEKSTSAAVIEDHYSNFTQTSCSLVPGEQPDDCVNTSRGEFNLKDRESYSQLIEETSSTVVLVEQDTHLPRWTSLRSLARILSSAFAKLADVVLMFSTPPPDDHDLTSCNAVPGPEASLHEVTSAVYPAAVQGRGNLETICKHHLNEQEVHLLNIPQRTFSTDSFEIIETSCFTGATGGDTPNRGQVSQNHDVQSRPQASKDSLSDRLDFSSQHFSSEHETHLPAALTDVTMSSTDFVSFDFQKLLTDGQLRVDKSGSGSPSRVFPSATSCSSDSDYVIVGETWSGKCVNGDSNVSGPYGGHHDSSRADDSNDSGNNDADDDDGDSSASFIILSDNDTNTSQCI